MNPNYMFVGPWHRNPSCSLATYRRLERVVALFNTGLRGAELQRLRGADPPIIPKPKSTHRARETRYAGSCRIFAPPQPFNVEIGPEPDRNAARDDAAWRLRRAQWCAGNPHQTVIFTPRAVGRAARGKFQRSPALTRDYPQTPYGVPGQDERLYGTDGVPRLL